MRQLANKIKPAAGFSQLLHLSLVALLPALVYIFVRAGFLELAVAIVLVGKWRMFSVKPRHWPANLRSNAVDILVGLSVVVFMSHAEAMLAQLMWAVLYGSWLLLVKPKSNVFWIGAQAMIAQAAALMAIYSQWAGRSTFWLVFVVAGVCYLCARHFMSAFDEAMGRTISYCWSFMAACVVWLTGHWLIYYGAVAQPTLLLTVVGYGLASLYYLQYKDRLSVNVRRQVVMVLCALVFIIIMFSDRSDKIVR